MSVANAGIAAAGEHPPPEGEVDHDSTFDESHPIAPDQFDPEFETTKWETWSYYSYYVGNNGLSLFNFAPTSFQDLLYEAAGDSGKLVFLGRNRTINSIVLLANGISFAIQVVLFLVIGSFADYGTWRPYILVFWSVVAYGIGFGWLGVHTEDKWQVATGLYMVGLIAYQMCITFWTAAFPGLARNTVEMRLRAEEYESGAIDRDKYDYADMMMRNRLQNVAFIMQSLGEIVILAILVGILFACNVNASAANNLWGLSVLIAYASAVWLVLSIPWFWFEKHRPGQQLPPGMNIVSVGFWQLYRAFTQIWKLKQTLLYLIGKLNWNGTVRECETNCIIQRLLSFGRLSQHNCHSHRNATEYGCVLQHANSYLPLHCGHRSATSRHLRLLDNSKALPALDKVHVRYHNGGYYPPRRLGNDWNLDDSIRLPSRMGVLVVSGVVRSVCVSVVLLQSNHDQRGHASRQGISLLRAVQHHGQDECFYWPYCQQRHHRRQQFWEQQSPVLLLVRPELLEFWSIGGLC